MKIRHVLAAATATVLAIAAAQTPAFALNKVRAAKSVNTAWAFIPLDVGAAAGIWAKYGLDADISGLGGDAKLQQALTSDSVDFGLGSGPSMAFAVKGSPVVAVAAFAEEPRNISVVIAPNSPIKTVADLKGKLISVTTAGSLTDWLVHRLSVKEGWGTDGVRTVALGGFEPSVPALKTGQIDGIMAATEAGYLLEERGEGRILIGMEKYAPKFHTHVVFARKALVAENPDLVTRFLKGFFASIAYMKSHKEETSKVAEAVLKESPQVASKTYDYEISMLEDDGRFDPEAIEVIKQSLADMKMLDAKPTDDQLFTTKFTPVKLP
ncbi:MAG TPA: ABC transporter substrate-binding protein [Stellaceae bacterium]|jgi:ABC-type nitrate/sulfonate/bicarbonate transport system substrate-binding protein|nr:ABC transporter substrate-binding protein [Stellaceae bacterium]